MPARLTVPRWASDHAGHAADMLSRPGEVHCAVTAYTAAAPTKTAIQKAGPLSKRGRPPGAPVVRIHTYSTDFGDSEAASAGYSRKLPPFAVAWKLNDF